MTLVLDPTMINETAPQVIAAPTPSLSGSIEDACKRIPPLWPLKHFVAVNPFLGLSDRTFVDSCSLIERVTHGSMLMPLTYYREQWESGHILPNDLQQAIEQACHNLPSEQAVAAERFTVEELIAALTAIPQAEGKAVLTAADTIDRVYGVEWAAFIVDEISKWCSAYYDQGQASWRMPWRGEPLYLAWKGVARFDASPELMGLHGFRNLVTTLPDAANDVIEWALKILHVPEDGIADFLHRQLMSIGGWSSYVQYRVRENVMHGHPDDSLQQLLAIRLVYDVALVQQYANHQQFSLPWNKNLQALREENSEAPYARLLPTYLWQLAAENAYQRQLLSGLKTQTRPVDDNSKARQRPAVQAIFCIDVRSEVFRRSFEAQSPAIETIGFAGFFGFPIEYIRFGQRHGSTQCPALITPKFRIRETLREASFEQEEKVWRNFLFAKRLGSAWNSFKISAVSCFSFVETGGLLSGIKIFKAALGIHHDEHSHEEMAPCVHHRVVAPAVKRGGHEHRHLHESGMKLDEQISVAAGALKNMGLTSGHARLVMVCGHGSSTVNNPYASGLDCGACGGHSGEANARVAAAVLNNPPVRDGLRQLGIEIPADTWFIAALHNTTTDDITLFDTATVPPTHKSDLAQLEKWLQAASRLTRKHRAPRLGLQGIEEAEIDEQVRARSRDWSQVRPEWGLAGNASLIAAPRERTKALNLGGRAFLNNYDYRTDNDNTLLEAVMTAPMIVGSWINLQYYASTVNNQHFGSGNKVIHNVVGALGVWQGNSGDLKVGLPLQSLHNGEKWMHEPLRLTVLIEAPRQKINQVIEAQPNVRDLLDNGWLHLIAIEDDGQHFARYCGDLHWKSVEFI